MVQEAKGCLFEDDLCRASEVCVNDGVFGRCQRSPAIEIYQYDVSPAVQKHLRATLQKLSRAGFTWQDDYTQHVMTKELANLPKTYPRRAEASSREGSNPARASKQSIDHERSYGLENDVTLAKTLQQYLPYLGVLSQATASNVYPRMKTDKPPIKSDDSFPESVLTYVTQTSKGGSSVLTYPPMSRASYPEDLPLRTFGPLQLDELSPKVDSSLDRQNLIAALNAYAAQRPVAPGLDRASVHRSSILAPPVPQAGPYDETPPGENDRSMLYLLQEHVRTPRPVSAPTALQQWPSALEDPKEPLSTGADMLIQNLLKDLRKQQVDVDSMDLLELDAIASVIADAMHDAGAGEDRESGKSKAGGKPREEAGSSAAAFYEDDKKGDKDNGVQEDDDKIYEELATPFKTNVKKSKDPESSEEESVGVENVKSETYFKELFDKKPNSEPRVDGLGDYPNWIPGALKQDESLQAGSEQHPSTGLQLEVKSSDDEEYGYIVTETDPLSLERGTKLIEDLAHLLTVPISTFADISVTGPAVTFRVNSNTQNVTSADVAKAAVDGKGKLEETSGVRILQTGIGSKSKLKLLPHQVEQEDSTKFVVLTLISIACIVGVLLASGVIYCLRHSSHYKLKEKLSGLGGEPGSDATAAYQELCRQHMAGRSSERPEPLHTSRINSVSSQFSDGPMPSPSARSSTSSWSEEPVQSNMDISTGHMILSYMEDHLKNKNRLEKEWEALCAYQAEPNSSLVAQREENLLKNRCLAVLTYDHSRILLKSENSHSNSDYINASPILDHDPRNPAYIATQGPLPATVTDFWQMVWESGCVVIVMLTPLAENGVKQCYHYWPDEGSNLYHIYEVNLVSEHIWCEDFLVRSFYLKNLQTNETRTVTQFHFLSWYDQGVPSSTRSLLDFRRKVNKCYRGRSCPIIVHCSDGAGRSGTYVLIDMVLNKMAKGEIQKPGLLYYLREARKGLLRTKEQFEFALTAVAEEVNAILKALPQ
ncbi:receptor-type tyrosine-protein phosphatase N2 [Echinops telfairi]|uniref:Receptor-type tyrosine-protein phosphatase N2 n=1 Tax=Echinops telfairi TaxID=9371 RepID=A0AC55D2V8_ECHTE|nr:receptor-type tyrosine-protein phosphatase N2 [Echinops telfairi]